MAASFGFRNMGRSGAILERNVKDAWWREAVDMRDDIVAFDSSIVIHQSTLIASGHVASFRADYLAWFAEMSGLRYERNTNRTAGVRIAQIAKSFRIEITPR
jgi:glycyl-tRNA synthetase (class II)